MSDPSQQLSVKDAKDYRSIPKLQEQKQYKRALKVADGILKNNPNHGETISLKALTLNHLGRKEEAYSLCKLGLMKTKMKSQVAWHIYGLVYRSDRNYVEAVKCYRNSLRIQESANVLRDLGVLQIQTRDTKGYAETRKNMLVNSATQRSNWVGFSLAHHMCGNRKFAMTVLDTCLSMIRTNASTQDKYQQSEMLMYKAMLMEESGDLAQTLAFLDTFKEKIVDSIGWRQRRASINLRLGNFAQAREDYELLVEMNPESFDNHRGLQASVLEIKDVSFMKGCTLPTQQVLDEEASSKMVELYEGLRQKYPKAFAIKRIPLDFLTGDKFVASADAFLKAGLRKGIPALFSTLRPLYKAAHGRRAIANFYSAANEPSSSEEEFAARAAALPRVEALGKLVQDYIDSLRASKRIDAAADDEDEPPTTFLWCLFYMAQHLDMAGEQGKALAVIDEAIDHTPTLVDLYHVKARVLKHMGDLNGAGDTVEAGRKLDLADKWINSKASKYLLRAGRIGEGEKVVALFTKHEGDSRDYLFDMQTMWYEIEAGRAYFKAGNLAMALKFFKSVSKHFDDIEDDQLDFHTYCLRKFTLRAYVGMLRTIDEHRSHKFFTQAAHGAVQCYLSMHASSFGTSSEEGKTEQIDLSKMSAAERKKHKNKMRKLEAKKKKEEEERAAEKAAEKKAKKADAEKEDGNRKNKRQRDSPVDKDREGTAGFEEASKDPLGHAHSLLKLVNRYAPKNLQTHLDTFDVEVRRGKFLQATRALYAAAQLVKGLGGAEHPEVFQRLAPFLYFIIETGNITHAPWTGATGSDAAKPANKAVELSTVSRQVILSVMAEIGVDASAAKARAQAFYTKHTDTASSDLIKRVAACRTMLMIEPNNKDVMKAAVAPSSSNDRWEARAQVRGFLIDFGAPTDVVDAYEKQIAADFPHSISRPLSLPTPSN